MRRLLLLLLSFSSVAFAQTKPQPVDKKVQELDAYIQKAQKEWDVPGMAVVVVKDGKVLLSKGYGVRELGTTNAVDSKTLFACASTTKAMTATCMGILVDEGKVSWNDPVIKHLPEFQLYDPFVTREITIRDLFVHDTGLGNADFLWGIMDISGDEVLRKMRDVKPTYSIRSSFIYQNIFYLAAGKIIQKISGKPWNVFVRERIFQPLDMTRTFPLTADVNDPNQTKPHYRIEGKITVIEHTKADEIGPAGSVWSCVDDMGKWMRVMIDSSKYSGGRLLSAKTWTEMFKPQVLVPPGEFYPTATLTKPNWTTYGLGWFQHDYKGRKVNFHTGSLAGATAIHAQLPDEKLGVYVFGNYDHAEVRHALVYKTFDLFALGGTRDWSADFLKLYTNIRVGGEKQEKDFEAKRVAGTKPSLALSDYAGTYTDPLYGTVVITLQGEQLVAEANKFVTARFSHWHYDTFRGWYDKKWYGKGNMSFVIGSDGKIARVNFDGLEFAREK
ncbi:MAG TPA: serine hydrolase [Cyclobacteriaceae bacterium]|nr:serine hydrolase [Cyclobacteriaceae bacterium]